MQPGTYAHFDTTEGKFIIRLFDKEAPNTVANFVGLAEGTKEWTDPATGQRAGHELQVRGRDPATGAVTLFNPWGSDALVNGYHPTPFPHTVVDAAHGLISVTAADFNTLATDLTR